MSAPSPPYPAHLRRLLAVLASGLLFAGCGSSGEPPGTEPGAARHALVIDAGSSGSRAHLYRWRPLDAGLPSLTPVRDPEGEPWTFEIRPALHTFAADPEVGAGRLTALLDASAQRLGGAEQARDAPLWLLATAGVRGLAETDRTRLMKAVEEHLDAGPFDLREVRTLTGEEEAAYAWVAVNLVADRLVSPEVETLGALDLGGASTQVTFEPTAAGLGGFELPTRPSHHLFTRSFLGLGHDRARASVDSPDCFPPGFPLADGRVGRGAWEPCREAIRSFLEESLPADAGDPDLLPGVPPLEGDLVGISVFRYTADFFGLGPRLVPTELEEHGRRHCATPWLTLQAQRGDDPYLETRCFAAAYIVTLLTDGYGLEPGDDRVHVAEVDPGWALGAAAVGLEGRSATPAP